MNIEKENCFVPGSMMLRRRRKSGTVDDKSNIRRGNGE